MLQKLIFVLLSPTGRITRRQFWWAWILILVLGLGLSQAQQGLGTAIVLIAYLYFTVTIYGKRLHDIGRSAWHLKWPFLIHGGAIVCEVVLVQMFYSQGVGFDVLLAASALLGFAPYVAWFVYAFVVGLPLGEVGDNRFGPNPLIEATRSLPPGSRPA